MHTRMLQRRQEDQAISDVDGTEYGYVLRCKGMRYVRDSGQSGLFSYCIIYLKRGNRDRVYLDVERNANLVLIKTKF